MIGNSGMMDSAKAQPSCCHWQGISELQKLGKELLGEKLYVGETVTFPALKTLGNFGMYVYMYFLYSCDFVCVYLYNFLYIYIYTVHIEIHV